MASHIYTAFRCTPHNKARAYVTFREAEKIARRVDSPKGEVWGDYEVGGRKMCKLLANVRRDALDRVWTDLTEAGGLVV